MISSEQTKDIINRLSILKKYLAIDAKKVEIANEEEKTFDPDFWNKPKEAEIIMKSLRVVKKWVSDFNLAQQLVDDLQILIEFHDEERMLSTTSFPPNCVNVKDDSEKPIRYNPQ